MRFMRHLPPQAPRSTRVPSIRVGFATGAALFPLKCHLRRRLREKEAHWVQRVRLAMCRHLLLCPQGKMQSHALPLNQPSFLNRL